MVLLKERFLFLVVTLSLKFLCSKSTSKYLQVSTLLFSFRILWSCVFSYQNQPYSGLIVHVGIKQYKFCLFIHWFCTWWILAYASHPHVCWLLGGFFLMILLIYSHFNLYFLLGSFYIYLTGLIQGIIMTNKGYMAPIWNCRGLKYLNILVPLGLNSESSSLTYTFFSLFCC